MEVIIGELAGFCPGVENAVEKARKFIESNREVYCLGELVHNRQVINKLEEEGMIITDNLEDIPDGSKVIFRAHGEAKDVYEKAIQKRLEVIDLTCGKVKLIHNKVEKQKENSFIIILGKKNHPEVIGTKGFAGENSCVVETEDDILDAYMMFEKTDLSRVYIVGQTTISSKYFDELSRELEQNFIEADVIIDKTICNATEKRQEEVKEISKNINSMIIIGGKNSSNTKELAKIAKENCGKVYLVETVEELKGVDFSKTKKIGIMAGASTPKSSIKDIENYLLSLN